MAEIPETVDPKVAQAIFLARIDKTMRGLLEVQRSQLDQGKYQPFSLTATDKEKVQDFLAAPPYTKVRSLEIMNEAAANLIYRINDRPMEVTLTSGKTQAVGYNQAVIESFYYRLASGTGTIRVLATW